MSTENWVKLASWTVLALLGAATYLRPQQAQHEPESPNRLKRFASKLLLPLYFVAIAAGAWCYYLDLTRKPEAPDFSFFINSNGHQVPLEWGDIVRMPLTNRTLLLDFVIVNVGNRPAERVNVTLVVPPVTVLQSDGWWLLNAFAKTNVEKWWLLNPVASTNTEHYYPTNAVCYEYWFETPFVVNMSNGIPCPPFAINWSNMFTNWLPVGLSVFTPQTRGKALHIKVEADTNATAPYIAKQKAVGQWFVR